jgi:hypothetical protein
MLDENSFQACPVLNISVSLQSRARRGIIGKTVSSMNSSILSCILPRDDTMGLAHSRRPAQLLHGRSGYSTGYHLPRLAMLSSSADPSSERSGGRGSERGERIVRASYLRKSPPPPELHFLFSSAPMYHTPLHHDCNNYAAPVLA